MATVIDLKDLAVESLSSETLDLVSQLTAEIRKASGKSFSFNDPLILLRIRRRVKRLKDPKVTALYYQYKQELLRSVNSGHFEIRPYQVAAAASRQFAQPNSVIA